MLFQLKMQLSILKKQLLRSYGKKGEKIVNMNNAAIDKGIECIVKINVPDSMEKC